jgi:outer membrane lipoprotein-sorting protein
MKNITIIFATVVLAGFLAACGDSDSAEAKKAKARKIKNTTNRNYCSDSFLTRRNSCNAGDSLDQRRRPLKGDRA